MFHNFKQFNIKAAAAHHPVIQKQVNELLAKGAIEASSGGAGLYSNVLVVPECTGGLWPISPRVFTALTEPILFLR